MPVKKDHLKLAVIGGGSSYTPELIEGLIKRHRELPVRDLYLVDIEAGKKKLEIIGDLARRMVAKAQAPINIHLTFDRREAIRDADFVTTQLRVGLLEARARDERIPLRHGCIGQETTGAGGFAKALRTIPVILDICRDMTELAPNAFLLNFTNPAGIVTEAVLKHTNVKSIGLCNLPIGTQMQVAKMMNISADRVQLEVTGINHLHWITRVLVDGEDVLKRFLAEQRDVKQPSNIPGVDWDLEFLRSLGAIPCAYHRYYYMKDAMLSEQLEALDTVGTRAEVVKKIEAELFALYSDPNLAAKPPQLEQRGGAYYSEAALNLMTAIHTNAHDLQVVNVQNNGALPCLPPTASIETLCLVDAQGAHPVHIDTPVQTHMRGLLQIVKAYEELTIRAAVQGDYRAALQALTIHPLVTSAQVAKRILDDILAENRDYLPAFFGAGGRK